MNRLALPVLLLASLCLALAAATPARGEHVTEVIDGVEWTTAKNLPPFASRSAKKGGELKEHIPQYITTLRYLGPNSKLTTITDIYGLTHETLLGLHPETHELIPGVASHWRKSDDNRTFWVLIDKRARFSNGDEITAADVVASYKLLVNPDIKDPGVKKLYDDIYELPVAESKYVMRIKTKQLSWKGQYYFSIFPFIYPEEEASIAGDLYLNEYNWKQFTGSGPYHIEDYERDLQQEVSITLTRRPGWWANQNEEDQYLYNFDKIRFVVVREQSLAFEKFKADEIDYIPILRSQRWVEECNFDKVQKGWVQKRKIYNEEPQSYAGFIFNMREWPFDDKNVRLAFFYAWNRAQLFDKFFFNEYEFVDSYYPGGNHANPKNRKIRYNRARAERLLDRAGYTQRNSDGIRVHEKTGKAFDITLEFSSPSLERIFKIVAEDMKAVGIKMGLKLRDYTALRKSIDERKFTLHYQSWRAPTFPNPMSQWHSDLAGPNTNNLSGFGDAKVDALITEYDFCFDPQRRDEIMREIDGIVAKQYTTALSWFAPFTRVLYWNRYGHPDTYLTRFTDKRAIRYTWWYDAEKDAALKKAIAEDKELPVGEMLVDPWGAKARLTPASAKTEPDD